MRTRISSSSRSTWLASKRERKTVKISAADFVNSILDILCSLFGFKCILDNQNLSERIHLKKFWLLFIHHCLKWNLDWSWLVCGPEKASRTWQGLLRLVPGGDSRHLHSHFSHAALAIHPLTNQIKFCVKQSVTRKDSFYEPLKRKKKNSASVSGDWKRWWSAKKAPSAGSCEVTLTEVVEKAAAPQTSHLLK